MSLTTQNKERSGNVSEEQKKDIKEMVEILGSLDREDLLLVKGGASMLAAKKELERNRQQDKTLINP